MSEGSDERRRMLTMLLLAAWALAFAASFVAFSLTEPTGDGFVRGMNRVGSFFGWQAIAGLIALMTLAAGRGLEKGSSARKMSRIPAYICFALILGVIALVAWARFTG